MNPEPLIIQVSHVKYSLILLPLLRVMIIKYYIILQPTIYAMGGEEMYTRNIVLSARQQGYVPIVFHSGIGGEKIYIDDLKSYKQNVFSEFRYEPCVISKKRKKRLIGIIKNILTDYSEESIIESHEILVAEWGEWIANQLGVRHFAYMLLEHHTLHSSVLYDFFRYKYNRQELAGIVDSTVPDMFQGYCKDIKGIRLPAYCNNVYEDIPCPDNFKIDKADYTIGSIGRTNKQYVQPMIDSIIRFIESHPDKTFNILYVGGSMNKQSESLVKSCLSSMPNARLLFTGMMFPLSIEMIRQMDVCISSAGSCSVSANCGVPTISLDGNDSKAIGIFKKTTNNTLFRSVNEPPLEIENLLDDILIKKRFQRIDKIEPVNVDFTSHWKFVNNMSTQHDYFDIDTIRYPFKRKLQSIVLGYYYGLSPNSIRYTIIKNAISLFS